MLPQKRKTSNETPEDTAPRATKRATKQGPGEHEVLRASIGDVVYSPPTTPSAAEIVRRQPFVPSRPDRTPRLAYEDMRRLSTTPRHQDGQWFSSSVTECVSATPPAYLVAMSSDNRPPSAFFGTGLDTGTFGNSSPSTFITQSPTIPNVSISPEHVSAPAFAGSGVCYASPQVSDHPMNQGLSTSWRPHLMQITFEECLDAARNCRYKIREAPSLAPEHDPTIDQVARNWDFWIQEMHEAMVNTTNVSDRPNSNEVKMFQHADPEEVKATSVLVFAELLTRCRKGFGLGEWATKFIKKNEPVKKADVSANCYERLQIIVQLLRTNKRICRDMLQNETKIKQFVHAPLNFGGVKDAMQSCNNMRQERIAQLKALERSQKEAAGSSSKAIQEPEIHLASRGSQRARRAVQIAPPNPQLSDPSYWNAVQADITTAFSTSGPSMPLFPMEQRNNLGLTVTSDTNNYSSTSNQTTQASKLLSGSIGISSKMHGMYNSTGTNGGLNGGSNLLQNAQLLTSFDSVPQTGFANHSPNAASNPDCWTWDTFSGYPVPGTETACMYPSGNVSHPFSLASQYPELTSPPQGGTHQGALPPANNASMIRLGPYADMGLYSLEYQEGPQTLLSRTPRPPGLTISDEVEEEEGEAHQQTYFPGRTWLDSHAFASAHLSAVRRPARDPHTDPTIQMVQEHAVYYVLEMAAAILNLENVSDKPGSNDIKMFSPGVQNAKDIEAICWLLFGHFIDRCVHGCRLKDGENKVLKPRTGCQEDVGASCEARISNVIQALRYNKCICRDVVKYGTHKMQLLVNAPLHVITDKKGFRKSNKTKANTIKALTSLKGRVIEAIPATPEPEQNAPFPSAVYHPLEGDGQDPGAGQVLLTSGLLEPISLASDEFETYQLPPYSDKEFFDPVQVQEQMARYLAGDGSAANDLEQFPDFYQFPGDCAMPLDLEFDVLMQSRAYDTEQYQEYEAHHDSAHGSPATIASPFDCAEALHDRSPRNANKRSREDESMAAAPVNKRIKMRHANAIWPGIGSD